MPEDPWIHKRNEILGDCIHSPKLQCSQLCAYVCVCVYMMKLKAFLVENHHKQSYYSLENLQFNLHMEIISVFMSKTYSKKSFNCSFKDIKAYIYIYILIWQKYLIWGLINIYIY